MSKQHSPNKEEWSVYREYVLGVRIFESSADETVYRFDAPDHERTEFADSEAAELYADVYFDVNGFVEAGTGDRGLPPAVVQAGKDTLAAYLVSQPGVDTNWVASFFGRKPGKIEAYLSMVRARADEIRGGVVEQQAERGES
ncbi:hypothetical protein [Haloplanus halobius]|uniref:hypothetical protein n=1 Tax=Haloplanus halobius TaxID=2934938 RepID=UPI00200D3A2C|nr:hypothetical protein [Haloplanus sp. XH21]